MSHDLIGVKGHSGVKNTQKHLEMTYRHQIWSAEPVRRVKSTTEVKGHVKVNWGQQLLIYVDVKIN